MSGLAFGYTLVAALAFSCLDLVRKFLAGKIRPLPLVFFLSAGTLPFLTAWFLLDDSEGPVVTPGYVLPGLAVIAIQLIANLFFFLSLRYSPMSRTVPYLSLTPVFTALAAIPILGELPDLMGGAGICLVVCGALILNRGEGGLFNNLLRERGSLLMIAVAALWSIAGPVDKYALEYAVIPFHALTVTSGITLGVLIWLAAGSRLGELGSIRKHYGLILPMMIAVTVGYVFQLLAISIAKVASVETFKRSMGCFMAVVFGRTVFKESVTHTQVIAVLLMIAGVVLLFVRAKEPAGDGVAEIVLNFSDWTR